MIDKLKSSIITKVLFATTSIILFFPPVLKGADTIIALPDGNVYVNLTGNSGMARGGSGDVLAGLTASFLAQGMSADQAAILGVYYHGLAGDRCAEKLSARTMLPSDMIEALQFVL